MTVEDFLALDHKRFFSHPGLAIRVRGTFLQCLTPPTGAMELGPYNTGNELPTQQFIACIVRTRFIASVVHRHARCKILRTP